MFFSKSCRYLRKSSVVQYNKNQPNALNKTIFKKVLTFEDYCVIIFNAKEMRP